MSENHSENKPGMPMGLIVGIVILCLVLIAGAVMLFGGSKTPGPTSSSSSQSGQNSQNGNQSSSKTGSQNGSQANNSVPSATNSLGNVVPAQTFSSFSVQSVAPRNTVDQSDEEIDATINEMIQEGEIDI